MDIREYLRKEIEKSEALQALLDLAGKAEAMKAEVSAHSARIADLTAKYEDLQSYTRASEEGTKVAAERYAETVKSAADKLASLNAAYDQKHEELEKEYNVRAEELENEEKGAHEEYQAKVKYYEESLAEYEARTKAAQKALDALKKA